jgi:hypothetical protein
MDGLEIMQRRECEREQVRLDEFAQIGEKLVDCITGYDYNAFGEYCTRAGQHV